MPFFMLQTYDKCSIKSVVHPAINHCKADWLKILELVKQKKDACHLRASFVYQGMLILPGAYYWFLPLMFRATTSVKLFVFCVSAAANLAMSICAISAIS